MSKIKLVIEIDEEIIKETQTDCLDWGQIHEAEVAIANGTPLPKGHGDLIDRTQALQEMAITPLNERNFNSCVEAVECVPTIVEADKDEQED